MTKIREATLADLPGIITVWRQGIYDACSTAGELSDEEIEEIFRLNINSQNDFFKFWIATRYDEVIGWCSILPFHPNPILRNSVAFCSIYIGKDHQNTIVAYKLLKHADDFVIKTPIKYVLGTISSSNERIMRLAFKFGWKQLAKLPNSFPLKPAISDELIIFEPAVN